MIDFEINERNTNSIHVLLRFVYVQFMYSTSSDRSVRVLVYVHVQHLATRQYF